MDILGLDAGQWTPMEVAEDEAVDTYTASVTILGVNATAVAWQVWQDDSGTWTAYDNDKEVDTAFGAVFAGDVFGWRGMNEHGYGFGMEPVHVDAWDGDFVFAIITVGEEPEVSS